MSEASPSTLYSLSGDLRLEMMRGAGDQNAKDSDYDKLEDGTYHAV